MNLYHVIGIVLGIFGIYSGLLVWLNNKQSKYEEFMNSRVLVLEKEQNKIILNYVERFGKIDSKLDHIKLEIIQAINNLAKDQAVKDEKLNNLIDEHKKIHEHSNG